MVLRPGCHRITTQKAKLHIHRVTNCLSLSCNIAALPSECGAHARPPPIMGHSLLSGGVLSSVGEFQLLGSPSVFWSKTSPERGVIWRDEHWVLCYMLANGTPIKKKTKQKTLNEMSGNSGSGSGKGFLQVPQVTQNPVVLTFYISVGYFREH